MLSMHEAGLLEWGLRGFGLLWAVLAGYAIRQARSASFMDDVLEALENKPQDRLTSRFMLSGAVLTLVGGAALAAASRWALLPLAALLLSQLVYFGLKARRLARATSETEREDARVMPATRNAFYLSLAVTALALLGAWQGALR